MKLKQDILVVTASIVIGLAINIMFAGTILVPGPPVLCEGVGTNIPAGYRTAFNVGLPFNGKLNFDVDGCSTGPSFWKLVEGAARTWQFYANWFIWSAIVFGPSIFVIELARQYGAHHRN